MGAEKRPAKAESGATELSIQEALRLYTQQSPLPFAIARGPEHTLVYANPAFCRLADAAEISLGKSIAAGLAPLEGRALISILDRAFRERLELLDVALDAPTERAKSWRCSVWPVVGEDGETNALGIQIQDGMSPDDSLAIQRQVAERMLLGALRERGFAEDAEAARRRAAFLAEAGRLLAESVDRASTLLALTKLVLPALGAWCIVDILDVSGGINRLGIYHADPEKQTLARELETKWVPEPDDRFGAPAMLREAKTFTITEDIEVKLASTAQGAENMQTLRQLGIGPLLTVPLLARKKLLGAITFVSADPGFVYAPEDVELAEDLAARGALALDNAQVYDLAVVLQRSAESANLAKSEFLSAMSHELRTPLNAIGGYIDLLDMGLRGPVTPEQHADFARVRTSQKHLTLLISEILNFARAGSGRLSYDIREIKACAAMQHAVDLVEPLFAQNGLVFEGVSGDPTIVARGDSERVTQILVNLLSNAIKFTPTGGRISAHCGATAETVAIEVRDTGIGIATEKLEVIFEPFVQLKEGLSEREGGVGLGLAISRDLAHAMKGDLTVQSSEGEGARFTLFLPRSTEQETG
jgi:signal transduction histidine kinase